MRDKGESVIDFPDKYIVIDTETTGLDPVYCDIIEIGAIKYENGKEIGRFSELVQPEDFYLAEPEDDDFCILNGEKVIFIDSFITHLTGITNSMLQDTRPQEDIFKDFQIFIGDSVPVGHNVGFDINFIYDAFERYLGVKLVNDYIDTMRIARKVLKEELQHHRLRDIAKLYNITQKHAHRVISDCETTNACFVHLKDQVIGKYQDIDSFKKTFSKCRSLSAKDITTTNDVFDEDSPVYGRVFVFTGALDRMLRREAMQLVVDKGGVCGDSITKKTNFLVLGNNDYCSSIKDGKSNKQKKAEQLKLDGYDIGIISENVFYEMVEE